MTNDATSNPYWAQLPQGPVFDTSDVRSWCSTVYTIFLGSQGLSREYITPEQAADDECESGWVSPELMELYQSARDEILPTLLLRLAISIRTLQDKMDDDEEFAALIISIDENAEPYGGFLHWYEGPKTRRTGLRELCNKIIHGLDMRQVHNNDDQPRDQGPWSMTGEIEIQGTQHKDAWYIVFRLDLFLEAALEIAKWVDKKRITMASEPRDIDPR